MTNFTSIILLQTANLQDTGNQSPDSQENYFALIFYVVGAFAAFYFYRKLKKKK
jgi:hypothetical protein